MKHFKRLVDWQMLRDLAAYYSSQKRYTKKLPLPGDPKKGRKLSKQCSGCHGVLGSTLLASMPDLAGQNAGYLTKAIMDYQNGNRQNALMRSAVRSLEPSVIKDLASYYAQLKPNETVVGENKKSFDPISQGRRLAVNCQGCHGIDGNSVKPGTPSINTLSLEYFISALKDYRDGTRQHRMMTAFTKQLNAIQAEKLGLYYAQAKPITATQTTTMVEPDTELLVNCNGCHGYKGVSTNEQTPSLAGQDKTYLRAAIKAYQSGLRPNEAMQNATSKLSLETVDILAGYYSAQTPKSPSPRVLEPPKVLAKKCDRCHGQTGHSTQATTPTLAGQFEAYLVRAMLDYKNGDRINSMMFSMIDVLSLSEIEGIAAYYSTQ